MPYQYWVPSPKVSRTSFDYRRVNEYAVMDIPQFHRVEAPEEEYIGNTEYRSGTNNSTPLERKVRSKPKVRIRKKTVGYEFFYSFKKKVVYLPDGRRVTRSVKKVGYKPITLRYVDVELASAAEILAVKAQPLFPNPLLYIKQEMDMTPHRLHVNFNVDFNGSGNRDIGSATFEGPGRHLFTLTNLVSIGTVNSLNTFPNPGASDESAALFRLYSKVGSAQPSLTTAIGESPELAATLLTIFDEGYKLARAILKLRIDYILGKAASTLDIKKISQLWLTWVYGIKPVISDLQDTLRVLSQSDRLWRSYTVTTTTRRSSSIDDPPAWVSAFYHGLFGEEDIDSTTWGVLLLGRLSFDKYLDTRVKGAQNAIATAYELAPFSFMLDWFIDFGSYLASAKIFSEQEYKAWRTRCRTHHQDAFGHFGENVYMPGSYLDSLPFRFRKKYFVCERTPLSELPGMPFPTLIRADHLFDMSQINKAINALAIAITRSKL